MVSIDQLYQDIYKAGHYEGLDLTPKQIEALTVLNDPITIDLLFGGGANGGKSWVGCVWLLMNAISYPETRWFIGREELKRLRESTLLTLFKVVNFLGIGVIEVDLHEELVVNVKNAPFKYNSQDHFLAFKNGSRIDLLDLKLLPSDPLYERYGSVEYTGGWIEEGGEVNFAAYDTLKSRVGRQHNDKYGLKGRILITCNPKKNWMYSEFYKPFREGKLKPGYKFIQSLVGDNTKRESGAVEALQNLKDKVKRERLLLGNWEYEDDPAALFAYENILDLFTNHHVADGKRYITADVARFGSDATVILVWSGFKVIDYVFRDKTSVTDTVNLIRDFQRKHHIPASQTLVDEDGVGGGVKDTLGCKGFVNNARPVAEKGLGVPQYQNLKSQCYYKLADRVNKAQMYWPLQDEDIKVRTIEELEQIKRKDPDKDGKQAVIPKDELKEVLGRSPDVADALMMREYLELVGSGKVFL